MTPVTTFAITLTAASTLLGLAFLECSCNATASAGTSNIGGTWVFTPTTIQDGTCNEGCTQIYGCIWEGTLAWQAPSGTTGTPMLSLELVGSPKPNYTQFPGDKTSMTATTSIEHYSECGGFPWQATAWTTTSGSQTDLYHFECEDCSE